MAVSLSGFFVLAALVCCCLLKCDCHHFPLAQKPHKNLVVAIMGKACQCFRFVCHSCSRLVAMVPCCMFLAAEKCFPLSSGMGTGDAEEEWFPFTSCFCCGCASLLASAGSLNPGKLLVFFCQALIPMTPQHIWTNS